MICDMWHVFSFSFALIFFPSFPFVYAMRKCAQYMGGRCQAKLMLLGYYLSHYIMVYLLVVLLRMCVCVANKFDWLTDSNIGMSNISIN